MFLGKIILNHLPLSTYHKLRHFYRHYKKKLHKPLDKNEFREILQGKLGLGKGDVVFIHSSIDKLNINFSPFVLLELLLEVVGEEGTLLFPSWHFNYRAEEYLKKDLVFNVKRSPSALGLLSELARRHPKAMRSLHPTSSIVAIGPLAEILTTTHHLSIYPCGELSPFYLMLKYNARIIGLGVSTEFLSFVHCPEDIMNTSFPFATRKPEILTGKVVDTHGNEILVPTLVAHPAIADRNIPKFIKKHISPTIALDFNHKGNQFFHVISSTLYDRIVQLAKDKKITIYKC